MGMRAQAPTFLQFSNQREIRYMMARSAFEKVVAAVHGAAVQHNASGTRLFELVDSTNRLEIFQQGLIFAFLTISFDEGTAEITYRMSRRMAAKAGEQGTIVPGYAGKILLLDKNGVAHRVSTKELVRSLLSFALEPTEPVMRAA
jgi:hypothetical protein